MIGPDPNGWMPIETAPKGNDASAPYILLQRINGIMAVGAWVGSGWYLPGGAVWQTKHISHWQPLPPPPVVDGGKP